jgi:iron uptake system component EfeO
VPTSQLRRRTIAVALVITSGLAASCSTAESDTSVSVTGTNDSCELSQGRLDAGRISFEFTNEADDISELYVLRPDGDVVSEVENVTTGTQRTLVVELEEGDYEVRCKPGQAGDGFASAFEVVDG